MGNRNETLYHSIDFLDSERLRTAKKDYFSLDINFSPINLSTTSQVTTNIPDDGDFLWVTTSGSFFQTDNVTVIANPGMLIQFRDSASGRDLQSAALHVATCVGVATNPFVLPYPRLFKRATTIVTTLQNLSAATNANVHITLAGFKIFS